MSLRLLVSGSPIRFTALTTIVPASALPCSAIRSGMARAGTASTTTSASASASPTARTGAPPGPSPGAWREPYTTSCPAAWNLPPSVPPIWPVPMIAIFMLAP